MQLDVIVTANIQGNLGMLPRLYTAIRTLKDSLPPKTLLIDTGRAWSADEWVCVATENRAPYFALDAMGYDAAFADGLSTENFEKVRAAVQMELIVPGAQYFYTTNGVSFGVELPMPAAETILHLRLNVAEQTITQQTAVRLTETTLSDPTIVGAVDFIMSEARYYQKKREAAP